MNDDLRKNMGELLKALANDEKYKPDVFANRLVRYAMSSRYRRVKAQARLHGESIWA
jgi:hypothetical protein